MGNDLTLKISDISKEYVGVRALDHVSFEAVGGEVIGLVGVNGAGKSTLMNILGGVTTPTSGRILINDEEVRIRTPKDSEALGIGFIHQEPVLFSYMTVAENISITKLGNVLDYRKLNETAAKYLAMIGSTINPQTAVSKLPIGEQQMVAIARALSENGRILLFDEPTSSFTVEEKKRLFEVIRMLKKQGAVIFYISHFLDEIEEICDHVVILRDGKLVLDERMKNLTCADIVKNMISGEIVQIEEKQHAMDAPALQVSHLCQKGVLKDVSFTVHKGEIVGLWGLMGSGRTELLRAIYGLDKIDSGSVEIADENGALHRASPHIIEKYCGFLTESRHDDGVFLPWSIWENIAAPNLKKYKKKKLFLDFKSQKRDAQKYSEQVRVKTPSVDVRVEQLSGGNQQKVILAKWLMRAPSILLLDEPTRGVDVGAKAEIQKMLCEFTGSGVGMLVVSSELEELSILSDRVLVINNGAIVAEIKRQDVDKDTIMSYCV